MNTITLQSYLLKFQNWSSGVIEAYGYLGIFIISIISASSIVLPVPGFTIIFAAGAFLNPTLVAVISGIGFGIGELTGVLLGRGGRKALEKKYEKELKDLRSKVDRYGPFLIFLIFAATPLPDDVSGVFAGIINYNWKKFLLASIIGKTLLSLFLAYSGYFGINWLINFPE